MAAWDDDEIIKPASFGDDDEIIANANHPVAAFLSGVGGSVLDMAGNAADLVSPSMGRNLKAAGQEGIKNAPGAAGRAGQTVGDIAPYFFLPGGLAAQSIGSGLLTGATTEGSLGDRIAQGIISGGSNALLGGTIGAIGKGVANKLKKSTDAANAANKPIARLNDILNRAQDANYVVPPADVNPTFINKKLQSIAGKAATGQQAQLLNQQATTELSKKALNMPDAELSGEVLDAFRKVKGKPYKEVSQLPSTSSGYSFANNRTTAAQDLENLKNLRFEAKALFNKAAKEGDPRIKAEAQKAWKDARNLEAKLIKRARDAGKPELAKDLSNARKDIAKSYTVESGLNEATGNIDPNVMGKYFDKRRPLTGELKLIGEFQQAFPKANRAGEMVPTPGVSKSEALASGLLGTVGASGFGAPGVALGALPLISEPIRNLLLSKAYQQAFAKIPEAQPSTILKLLNSLTNSQATKKSVPAINELGQDFILQLLQQQQP